jgi:hypothetical protein
MLAFFIFGVIGIVSASVISIKTVRNLANEAEIEKKVGEVDAPVLKIYSNIHTLNLDANYKININDGNGVITILDNQVYNEGIKLEYRLSKDSLYHVYQKFSANSYAYKTAIEKAKNIKHGISIENDELHINTDFTFPLKDKMRDQEVAVIIEIPKGKRVNMQNANITLRRDAIDFDEEFEYEFQSGFLNGSGEYKHW